MLNFNLEIMNLFRKFNYKNFNVNSLEICLNKLKFENKDNYSSQNVNNHQKIKTHSYSE
jgi:hypothetical protein